LGGENQKLLLSHEDDQTSRLTNRLLKTKTNLQDLSSAGQARESMEASKQQHHMLTRGASIDTAFKNNKENSNPTASSFMTSLSSSSNHYSTAAAAAAGQSLSSSNLLNTSSLLSASTTSSTNGGQQASRRTICIKEELVKFPDTPVDKCGKATFMVHNREDFDCMLQILPLCEPFYCKHTEIPISSKHYIKIPVEFRPRRLGDYKERVIVRVSKYDAPLACTITGRCI
jgi:hypothetical protein